MIRRMAGLVGVLGVLLSTLMLLGTGPAFACSCVVADTASHIADADLVFTGQVTAIEGDRQVATYTVRAERVFKGTLPKRDVEIDTSAQGTACGVELPESTEAVFFVTGSGDGLNMSLCGGTTALTADLEDEVTAVLGDGQPASDAVAPGDKGAMNSSDDSNGGASDSGASDGDGELALAVGAGILALVAAVVIGVVVRRRRRA
jgi:hypothetical protein